MILSVAASVIECDVCREPFTVGGIGEVFIDGIQLDAAIDRAIEAGWRFNTLTGAARCPYHPVPPSEKL